MKSARLVAYLELEHAMLELDAADDPFADNIRDMMDPLWRSLSGKERAHLDSRGAILDVADVLCEPPLVGAPSEGCSTTEVVGWECPV